jgi:flagellar biosynthesis protein FlhB
MVHVCEKCGRIVFGTICKRCGHVNASILAKMRTNQNQKFFTELQKKNRERMKKMKSPGGAVESSPQKFFVIFLVSVLVIYFFLSSFVFGISGWVRNNIENLPVFLWNEAFGMTVLDTIIISVFAVLISSLLSTMTVPAMIILALVILVSIFFVWPQVKPYVGDVGSAIGGFDLIKNIISNPNGMNSSVG